MTRLSGTLCESEPGPGGGVRDAVGGPDSSRPGSGLREADTVRRRRSAMSAYRRRLAGMGRVDSRGAALCRTSSGSIVKTRLYSGGHVADLGVHTCDSVWSCPQCSIRIAWQRKREVAAAIRAAHAAGYRVFFRTLTMSHVADDSLQDSFDSLAKAWRWVQQSAPWRDWRDCYGLVGQIVAIEVTAGLSGWHPHQHGLMFVERDVSAEHVRSVLLERWTAAARRQGRYVSDAMWTDDKGRTRGVGVDVLEVHCSDESVDEVAAYLTKWGVVDELSATHAKRGGGSDRYSAMQLLELAADGDRWAEHRWIEYEKVTAGRQQMRWTAKLRFDLARLPTTSDEDAVILGVEITDSEAAQDQLLDERLLIGEVETPRDTWNALCRHGREWTVGAAMRREVDRHEFGLLVSFMRRHE